MTANQPGQVSNDPPGSIVFRCDDGTRVLYGHLTHLSFTEDERVTAGDVLGRVGNNGYSRFPHLHIGAWRGESPLQIRFDLRALGRLQRENPDRYWSGAFPQE